MKILTISFLALFLSLEAHATQSRLLALGMNETDNEGMYYIEDGRNIFLNSAYVNLYPDRLVTEYGSTGALLTGNKQSLDQNHKPKAQGGVFKKIGSLVYGVYLGNESNTSVLLRVAATKTLATPIPSADNQVDFFIAGEQGIKWGANFTYAHSKDETSSAVKSKESGFATRLGVIANRWDAHANISLKSDAESASAAGKQEFDGKLGFQIGGSYRLTNEARLFTYVKHFDWDQKDTGAADIEGDFTSYSLGLGHVKEISADGGRIFSALTVKKTDINLKYAQKAEVRHISIPLNVGYEKNATEWLTLRGSIVQNLWGKRNNKRLTTGATDLSAVASALVRASYGETGKATLSNSTEVNAGATFNLGQVSIDGLLGLTSSARNGSTGTGATANKNQGLFALDNLATKVGLTYKF